MCGRLKRHKGKDTRGRFFCVAGQLNTGVTKISVEAVAKVAPNINFDIRKFNHI